MADVFDVANWFLKYNYDLREQLDEDTDEISNLKLQKLLYYAQGASLALRNKPMFEDDIEAWKHGPVVPTVYRKYKNSGSSGIMNIEEPKNLSKEDLEILKMVYDTFGEYSAWGLRNLTHSESPWIETERNQVIPQEKIKNYFKENYV